MTDYHDAVHYDTYSTREGRSTGVVAVYHDHTGTWVKITVNGVVRDYERIDQPTNQPTNEEEEAT